MKTYISLFSSAGVGCYGFKQAGFECIATNELIKRRLDVQKFNKKCKYDSGYLCGDITTDELKNDLYNEINMWYKKEKIKAVDVVIATPPCQGMSVANHKKNENEIIRNSLVIESIKIIKQIKPNFFIFENVPAFMKTACTDIDGYDKPIADAIKYNLGKEYSYVSKVINFKNYGASSSRTRTLVIGVLKTLADDISPYELFPQLCKEKTLKEVIGDMKPLSEFGEIDNNDIYHAFREYPIEMREWIHDLKEGQSAFDNEDENKKPHQIIDGKIVINQQKNADKYTRQYWNKVGPCVHTRNDQLASQNTIHPSDDRVFSIRELMRMMTIPDEFNWSSYSLNELNKLPFDEKKKYLKKEEIKIRQSLGEAVPTTIFYSIANNINAALEHELYPPSKLNKLIDKLNINSSSEMIDFINKNPLNLSFSALSRIAELTNSKKTETAAFYTNKSLITEMIFNLPDFDEDEIHILEPSCGVGNFIPLLFKRYEGKKLYIDLVDIDSDGIKIADALLNKFGIPEMCSIRYFSEDFLLKKFDKKYDLIIGNPPFYKMKPSALRKQYLLNAVNKNTNNICSYFLDKSITLGKHISIVFPKFILNTPEFKDSRNYLENMHISSIIDFGEKGFNGVLIETIALNIDTTKKPKDTKVINYTGSFSVEQKQSYIFDNTYPYWLIYRDEFFDEVAAKLIFDVFTVFRDRQITNLMLHDSGDIRVLKSRNISDDGSKILDISGYDSYINLADVENLTVYDYLDNDKVYLSPNMTYYPRVMKKKKGSVVNGSVAILIPKEKIILTNKQLRYFSSNEYRKFYQIARNFQTRSLNIDACSVFFFGLLKGE